MKIDSYSLLVKFLNPIFAFVFFVIGLTTNSYAQTGPGGIGNSAGTSALHLWLDANNGPTVVTNSVSTWTDLSGYGNTASTATVTNRPTYVSASQNGFPIVRFDGTDDYLDVGTNSSMDATEWSFFVVGKVTTNKNYNYWFGKGDDGSENYEFLAYTNPYIHAPILFTSGARGFTNSPDPSASVNSYSIWQYDYKTTTGRALYLNGASNTTDAENRTPKTNSKSMWIGNERTQSRYLNGEIAELIGFTTLQTTAQRIIVWNYLSAKYNITLASNDKYAGDNPAKGDYDLGVAGIGQSAAGVSNTAYSSSIAGGMGLTYRSGFSNGVYVMAGYQQPTNWQEEFDVSGIGGSAPARWLRDFYVDNNGNSGVSADFVFDQSDAGMPASPAMATASNYELLYRAGTSGAWTVLSSSGTLSGDQVTFANITITNTGYYTLGTKDKTASPVPIELLNFSAVTNKNKVNLNWTTQSETNNKFFTVERGSDGQHFKELLTQNSKAPNGNSNVKLNYTDVDVHPMSGTSYYRLKQTDYNGKFKYFNVVSVAFDAGKNITFIVYPNPNQGEFTADFSGVENNHEVQILLHDVHGRLVYSNSFFSADVVNSVDIVPSEKIGKGIYFCSLVVEGVKYVIKTVVE